MNDLGTIVEAVRRHPDVSFLVDAVSSMAGTRIPVDAWGIDVCLAGTQKAFALPPGLALASVSPRALAKAAPIPNRGYYFDLVEIHRYHERGETPSTPAIPQIQALDAQLASILAEGIEARHARHAALAAVVQGWARERFALFAEPGFESPTLTCVANTRGISVEALQKELDKRDFAISNGHGRLKETTFRIAHLGDVTEDEVRELLGVIDGILGI